MPPPRVPWLTASLVALLASPGQAGSQEPGASVATAVAVAQVPDLMTPAAVLYADSLIMRAQLRRDWSGLSMYIDREYEGWLDGRAYDRRGLLAAQTSSPRFEWIRQPEQHVIFRDSAAYIIGIMEYRVTSDRPGTHRRTHFVRHYVPGGGGWRLRSSLLASDR